MRRLLALFALALALAACSPGADTTTDDAQDPPASSTTEGAAGVNPPTTTAAAVGSTTSPEPSSSTTSPRTTSTQAPTTTTPQPAATTTSQRSTTTTAPQAVTLRYQEIAPLPFPVEITAQSGSAHAYIATKDGRVWLYDGTSVDETPVLDIRGRVRNQGEQGLLSIAIHPSNSSRFFAHYTANDGDTVVSEFAFTAPSSVSPDSERVLLRLDQPAANHNGGMIQFGPGGFLYVGLGDGGGGGDQYGHGQNTETLLGGIVRLSVDGDPSPTLHSYGLRNPWRFWIDSDTIYIADVGQNRYEEVSVVSSSQGLNFGWPIMEGLHCYRPSSGCDMTGLVLPQVEIAHGSGGTCSITGGIVYRGLDIPEIRGRYFYSDYCGGYLRSFRFGGGEAAQSVDWTSQVGVAGRVVGFGVDGAGEMYVATTTHLYKVVRDTG